MQEAENTTIWSHLTALRKRLLFALIGLVICVILSFFFTPQIIQFLATPIDGLQNLQAIEVTENASTFMRVALLSGFIIAFPWILTQLMIFILPGLTPKEKKWVFTTIPFATILFLAGAAFAFFILLPPALEVLINFLGVTSTIRIKSYFDFVTNIVFWIGISFELPLFMYILARLKIISAKMLLKGWRIAILAIAFLAAVITPTVDPVNMAIFMVPLFVLYLLSIILASLAGKQAANKLKEN
jgi:sec-independent protein translocase protein TatC